MAKEKENREICVILMCLLGTYLNTISSFCY